MTQDRPQLLRFVGAVVAVWLYASAPWFSQLALHVDWPWQGALTLYLSSLVVLLPFFVLLPYVSYRRRDILVFLFVPLLPVVWAAKVGWRATNLPRRSWPLRPDEMTGPLEAGAPTH